MTAAHSDAADLQPAESASGSDADAADGDSLGTPTRADAETAEHDPVKVAAGPETEAGDSETGDRVVDAETNHADRGALDPIRAGERKPERESVHRTSHGFSRAPDGDVRAVDPLEVRVAKVDPQSRHRRLVADREPDVVNREVDDLGRQRRRGQ